MLKIMWQSSIPMNNKNLQPAEIRGNLLNMMKGKYDKFTDNIKLMVT